jgi:hypothetical protein
VLFQHLNLFRPAIALVLLSLLGWEGDAAMAPAEAQDPPLWKPRRLGGGEMPLPTRVALADLIVIGKIDAIEDKTVEVLPSPGSKDKAAYRTGVVKAQEVLRGDKDAKEFRIGFATKVVSGIGPGEWLRYKPGHEGVFFLKRHHTGDFFVNFSLSNGLCRGEPKGGGFETPGKYEELERAVRKMVKMLEDPVTTLQGKDDADRYIGLTMLIEHYRSRGVKDPRWEEKPVDPKVSKLLLKVLAEADWSWNSDRLMDYYPPHPSHLFQQLGVTKKDEYDPPTDDERKTFAATQRWLLTNQETYSVKRFTPKPP